jgi:hypothetical protein
MFLLAGVDEYPDISVGQFIEDLTRLQEPFASCKFDLNERGLPIIHSGGRLACIMGTRGGGDAKEAAYGKRSV